MVNVKLELCQQLFDSNDIKNTAICNAMINAYGRNGNSIKGIAIYNEYFKNDGQYKLVPDLNTFNYLMNACNHAGDIQLATQIWENEIKDTKFKYDSYLMTSLIDCLSRNGDIQSAYDLIKEYDKNKVNNTK